jgi:hypothetical protein
MFTPIVFIFAIAAILGLIIIVKMKSSSDKKDHKAERRTRSTNVPPGRTET